MKKPTPTLKEMATKVDRSFMLRAKRLKLKAQADEIQKEETEINDFLIDHMSAADSSGVTGKKARASITSRKVATVKDWAKLYKHIIKTKDFAILSRSVKNAYANELWEDGKKIPGVEAFTKKKVSLVKAK